MSKPEWGTKRVCASCGAKYYDMRRTPILCPKCGVEFDPDSVLRSRRPKAVAKEAPKAAEKPKPETASAEAGDDGDEDDEDIELVDDADVVADDLTDEGLPDDDEDADDEALIEDASELGEDDDELADVVIEDDEKPDS